MQIALRLSDKRNVVEKEVIKYGDAPSGIKEVFELCRGFERAYVNIINVSAGTRDTHSHKSRRVHHHVVVCPTQKKFTLSFVWPLHLAQLNNHLLMSCQLTSRSVNLRMVPGLIL